MCRRNQLRGWLLAAFGLGLLVGKWIESGFLCLSLGLVFICLGCSLLRRR